MKAASLFVFCAGAVVTRPALCAEKESEKAVAFDAALLAGFGVSSGVDVIGPGLGLRLGFTGEEGLYAGLLGLVHLGSSDEGEPNSDHNSQSIRLELGYDIEIEPLVLRPTLFGGFTHVVTSRDISGSFWSPDVGVGATLLVRLDGPFIGFNVDARFLTRLVENGDNIFSIAAVAGYWVFGYQI